MNFQDIYDSRDKYFLTSSNTTKGGIALCFVIGAVTIAAGFAAGDPTRVWGSILLNLMYFFGLALGGIAFAAMQDTVGAVWGRPIMRLHESFSSFLPVAAVLFTIFLICIKFDVASAGRVYSWVADPHILDHFWGKKDWLILDFMIVRDIFALACIVVLAMWQLRQKLTRDKLMLAGNADAAKTEGLQAQKRLRYWSGPVLVVYALCFSLLAFDFTMSLAPLWYSTLWGGWSFAIMMQTLMASTLLIMFSLKSTVIGQVMGRQQFHDVGKLMHGFTIFFAYLTYAHVLTYWYGNMPEFSEYYLHRLHAPWVYIVMATPILVFVIPLFALIPKASKWTPVATIPLCGLILFAQWLTYILIVAPQTTKGSWAVPWIEFGVFLGVLGIFLSCIMWFGKRYPMVGIADPLLPEALAGGHH